MMKLPFEHRSYRQGGSNYGSGRRALRHVCRKALAQAGAKVAVLDLNEEAAVKVAEEIETEGGIAKAYKANVLDKESLTAVHEAVVKDLQEPADILINGAGGNNPEPPRTRSIMRRATSMRHHLLLRPGSQRCGVRLQPELHRNTASTQIFAQDMVDKEGCNILNISSMNAFTPLTKIPAYSGAKAAISNFTQWLQCIFKAGIRVNAIAPDSSPPQNAKLLFQR